MRLPWNKKYVEISFHIILTVLVLAGVGGVLFHLSDAKNVILQTAGRFLAVFAPVGWALFFSLLLEPLAAFFQRVYEKNSTLFYRSRIRNRSVGTAYAYLTVGLLLYLLGSFFVRKIGNADLQSIAGQISDSIGRAGDILMLLNLKLAEMGILQNVEGILSLWTEQMMQWMERKVLGFADILPAIGSSFLDILIGLAAAFYLLAEKEKMISVGRELLTVLAGKRTANGAGRLFHEVYTVFVGYFTGQILDAAIMAVLFSAAFLVVGLPHAVFLGLLSGFFNLIPYFGAVTAFILAVFSGLNSGVPAKAIYAAVLILLLQQADSIFLVPRVVGRRVELHPVLVLFSLAVFGRLFGFWGLIFAVPLGALCKSFLFWLYERKKSRISY
ncbi:MAG: AI-2E family transporter [Bacillota bacterium]|nr:AI-2E family transporter [Bacillota bacterium]